MDNAFAFVEFNGGLCLEGDYPYVSGDTGRGGTCQQKSCKRVPAVAPKGFTDVEINSEVIHNKSLVCLTIPLCYLVHLPRKPISVAGCPHVCTDPAARQHCD